MKNGTRNGRDNEQKCSKNQNNAFFTSKTFYFTKCPLNNSYRLFIDRRSGTRTLLGGNPGPSSTNGIRKLPTTHLATSSARKLQPSVRREGITRLENDANERGRKYY